MEVGKGGVRMELTAFDPDLPINGSPETSRGLLKMQANDPGALTQAVAHLKQDKCLTHTFGLQGEWEVRTTLVTSRQTWHYHSNVFVHGKEASQDFSPIDVDRTRHRQRAEAVTEEMVDAFAREAVEVHFARCASVAEYSLMASIFSQPPLRLQRVKKGALVLLSVAILLTAYWWWRDTSRLIPEEPESKPSSHSVRWQSLQLTHHSPAGEPFVFPLPALERMPRGLPVEVTLEASGDESSWLELDRERLYIRGTAPVTAADQTYQLSVRAHSEEGRDSRLLILLTITGQSERVTPTPQLRGHWTW
jgi:hypothetical protein